MRKNILKIITAIACTTISFGQFAYAAVLLNSGMTQVEIAREDSDEDTTADENAQDDNIRNDKNNNSVRLEPGTYYITGAKQVRILNSNGDILIFKGRSDNTSPFEAELPAGGVIEYRGTLYLTRVNESKSDEISRAAEALMGELEVSPQPENTEETKEFKQTVLSPFRYSPLISGDFMKISHSGYSIINNGNLELYNAKNDLKEKAYIPYAANVTGYVLSENIGNSDHSTEVGERISLHDGQIYTVGVELKEGSYTGKGSGTVRIYNPDGYVKTVIKLKGEEMPGNDGVNEYTFKLNINETVIPEGEIEFTELISETKDMGNQDK